MSEFRENQLLAYCPRNRGKIYKVAIVRFKRYADNKNFAFVYTHLGDTASRCSIDDLYKIDNDFDVIGHYD